MLSNDLDFSFKTNSDIDLTKINQDENFMSGSIQFKGFNLKTDIQLQTQFKNQQGSLSIKGPVTYVLENNKKILLPLKTNIEFSSSALKGQVLASILGLPKPLKEIKNLRGYFRIPLNNAELSSEMSEFALSTPINLFFLNDQLRKSLEKSCQCKLPIYVQVDLRGKANILGLTQRTLAPELILKSEVQVESLNNKAFEIDARAELEIHKHNQKWIFKPFANIKASSPSFRRLSPLLQAYGVLIPSPFDVLDGPLTLEFVGPVDYNNENYTIPGTSTVRLKSRQQDVNVNLKNSIVLDQNFKWMDLNLNINIEDLQLELPPLEPTGGRPRITTDNRIFKNKEQEQRKNKQNLAKKSDFIFRINIAANTQRPNSIRLLYRFFKPHVAIGLNIKSEQLKDQSGFIELQPFDLVYLRRRVHLDRLRLDFKDDEKNIFNVDGQFSVQQTMYKIFITVTGTSEHPFIDFSSDPHLERSDIISVLIYDRTRDQLVSADAETSGSVEAALSDRAIGLFSIWAFASTPVQSFHYNPISKVYTATLNLGDGVTAGIGSDWESSTQFELRKRLSRRWVLTGRWSSPSNQQTDKTELVLQWERRF